LKSMVLTGIRKMEMVQKDTPTIGTPGEVLLKLLAAGVCGSDIHYYREGRIGDQVVNYPFAVGHECVAEVIDIGNQVKGVKIGDTVAVDPCISCGECSQCLIGREHTCLNQKFLGSPPRIEGCLSEYIVMPEKNCYPLPPQLSVEEGVLVEPLSIGYYALQFLKKNSMSKIGILGVGPIGLSVLLIAQQQGIEEIFITDKLDYRLTFAQKNGAFFCGNPLTRDIVFELFRRVPEGLDAVFECCGQQDALNQAIEILKPGGKLIIVGIPEVENIYFNISKIRRKEITIHNVRRQNHAVEPVINLIAKKEIQVDFLVTHQIPFVRSKEAFDMVASYEDRVIKALIRF
jgi:L-iditol 2-dehydrogenase